MIRGRTLRDHIFRYRYRVPPKWATDGGNGSVVDNGLMIEICKMCRDDVHWWGLDSLACLCRCRCTESWSEHLKH
jgi:hypothetical protein